VSLMMSIRRKPREVPLSRFGRVQVAFRQGASSAAERIAPAARTTRDAAAGGVLAVRGRSAPWLEKAGTYVAADLGPRVGGMLSNAAHRMEPPKQAERKRRNAMMMMVGAVSAVGLAGALLTRRGSSRSMPRMSSGSRSESVPADVDGQVRAT
jgi:hypothetical protein